MLREMGKVRRQRQRTRQPSGWAALLLGLAFTILFSVWHPAGARVTGLLIALAVILALGGLVALAWYSKPVRWIMRKMTKHQGDNDDDDQEPPSGPGPSQGPVGSQGQTGGHTTQINYLAAQLRGPAGIRSYGDENEILGNTVIGFPIGIDAIGSHNKVDDNLVIGPRGAGPSDFPNRAARRSRRRSKHGPPPQPPSQESGDKG